MSCCIAQDRTIAASVHAAIATLSDDEALAKSGYRLFVPRPPSAVQWEEVQKWQASRKVPFRKLSKKLTIGNTVFQEQIIYDIRQLLVGVDYLTHYGHRLRRLSNDHLIFESITCNYSSY